MATASVQLFVSSTMIPNTLSLKMRGNDTLQSLLKIVCDSISDEDCRGLKLYHLDSCRWLPTGGDDTLFSFDLMLGGRLDLRNPVRLAKIRFLDDSVKTINVDETKSVANLIHDICVQLEVAHPEELSLAVAGDYEAPGKVGRRAGNSSPIGTLSRAGRPASISYESPVRHQSPLNTPPATARKSSCSSSPSAATSNTRFSMGRQSNPSLSPALSGGGHSPILTPAGQMPRSPSQRRKPFSPSAIAGSKESPLLDVKRSHTFSGRRDSPASLRISAAKAKVKAPKSVKNFSKKHGLRLNTPWLAPHLSLHEQAVTEEDELLLMYRMFYWTSLDKDTKRVDLLFIQAKVLFLNGEISCSDEKAAQFVALLCQCDHGDTNEEKFSQDWLAQQRGILFPSKYKTKKPFLQRVLQEHKSLVSVTALEAKCLLVQLWSTTPIFGYEFFSCAEVQSQKRGLIGVSKTKVIFIPHDAKGDEKKSSKFDLAKLSSWSHSSFTEIVRLTFAKSTLQLLLPDYSGVLADCVQCHHDLCAVFKSVPGGLDAEYNVVHRTEDSLSPTASRLQLTIPQARMERDKSLTFADVYWNEKIGNPLVTEEENVDICNPGLWHNPIYDKMEELVDERFQFLDDLDIDDDDDDDATGGTSPATRTRKCSPSPHTRLISQNRPYGSAPVGSILGGPIEAPLAIQVSHFTSSNDSSAIRAKDESRSSAAANASTSASKPRAGKKKTKGSSSKRKDPPSFGEMLSEAGISDMFDYSEDEEDDVISASAGPKIILNGDGGVGGLENVLWG